MGRERAPKAEPPSQTLTSDPLPGLTFNGRNSAGVSGIPFEELIRALSSPEAFPGAPESVECVQTHISAVFLVGDVVYKVKKPKKLLFLDFSELSRRRHFCHEEVRLNRRLAPAVYEGVVPILMDAGVVRVSEELLESESEEPQGEVLEWAVRMVRLPDERTLGSLLERNEAGAPEMKRLASRLARFHEQAQRGGRIAAVATWETIQQNHVENFEEVEAFVGRTISEPVFQRLRALTTAELDRRRELIELRARRGVPCETHGDLRVEHIYLLPPGTPGSTPARAAGPTSSEEPALVVIDCIEFNERFRWADPVADIAFLVMELEFIERPALAEEFAHRYFIEADDPGGADLLPYYATYRDVVRGKVRSFQAFDPLVATAAARSAEGKARRHFLRGLSRLSKPAERPGLVVVQGLPGVGKSAVAAHMERTLGFHWIDTDRVRKELTGASPSAGAKNAPAGFETGIYSRDWTERTYAECERRARAILFQGGRVIVEGSFRQDRHRLSFLNCARDLGVTAVFLTCTVDPSEARRRMEARGEGPSDADWGVHLRMAAELEPASPLTAPSLTELSLAGSLEDAMSAARAILGSRGLA